MHVTCCMDQSYVGQTCYVERLLKMYDTQCKNFHLSYCHKVKREMKVDLTSDPASILVVATEILIPVSLRTVR